MSLDGIQTYYILDLWCDAPESEGLSYILRHLRARGRRPSKDQIHHRIWMGLVALDLLDPHKKSTAREWKRAKNEYRDHYRDRITA